MSKKQVFLSEDEVAVMRTIVDDLVKRGIKAVLKGDAINNWHEPLDDPLYRGRSYMSPEQAWVTAVVNRLLSNGYEIRKKDDVGKKE